MNRFLILTIFCYAMPLIAEHPGKGDEDPYILLPPPGATRGTAGEEFIDTFSAAKAGAYLDLRRHNVEGNCYACHSSGAFVLVQDADKDGTVTQKEYSARATGLFTQLDTNQDGSIQQAELSKPAGLLMAK